MKIRKKMALQISKLWKREENKKDERGGRSEGEERREGLVSVFCLTKLYTVAF